MEEHNSAAVRWERCDSIKKFGLFIGVSWRFLGVRGVGVCVGVDVGMGQRLKFAQRPHPSPRLARRDSIDPGAKELRMAEPFQLPTENQERVLQCILGSVASACVSQQVTEQLVLHVSENPGERIAIAGLRLHHFQRQPLAGVVVHE